MQLFETKGTPNARRVHIFMAEKGIDLPRTEVDLRAGENISDTFKSKNPIGRIPVLELDDGTYLSESVAICRYLEGLHPQPPLFGDSAQSAAVIEMWNRRAEINFLMSVAMAFRNISGFFKDREKISAEWGAISQEVAADVLPVFDAQLAETEFLAGDQLSVADITLCVAYDFANAVKVAIPNDLPNINRWHGMLSERPSFSAA
jgi:glutathione S-transferase